MQEVSAKRKALSVVTLAIALFAAVVIQLTVVNRLPLPGGAAPDLVLLLVTAIAVAATPAVAAVTGFAGGLALDVAPPAAHYAGQYALVFCLAGYAASRVYRAITNTTGEQDRVAAFTVMVAATVAGEAGKAALGMLLSDPDVTTATVSHVLPGAILYDLLLSSLVFWLVVRVTRGAGPDRAPAPAFDREQRLASVFRPASAGAAPNLRLAGTGMSFGPRSLPRRVPSLRLSGTGEKYRSEPVASRWEGSPARARAPAMRSTSARRDSMSCRFTGWATPAIAWSSGSVQSESPPGCTRPPIAGAPTSSGGQGTFMSYPSISQRPRMIPRAGKSTQIALRRISTSWR